MSHQLSAPHLKFLHDYEISYLKGMDYLVNLFFFLSCGLHIMGTHICKTNPRKDQGKRLVMAMLRIWNKHLKKRDTKDSKNRWLTYWLVRDIICFGLVRSGLDRMIVRNGPTWVVFYSWWFGHWNASQYRHDSTFLVIFSSILWTYYWLESRRESLFGMLIGYSSQTPV